MSEKRAEQQPKPRKKHFKEQFEDEEALLVFRKHPIVMRKGLLLAAFGMLVGPVYTLILTYVHKNNPPSLVFFFVSLLHLALLFGFFVIWGMLMYKAYNNQKWVLPIIGPLAEKQA